MKEWNEYLIACLICHETSKPLAMFAHRSLGAVVGFVFKCKSCHEKYPDLDIESKPRAKEERDE